jgi:hypothetical protein
VVIPVVFELLRSDGRVNRDVVDFGDNVWLRAVDATTTQNLKKEKEDGDDKHMYLHVGDVDAATTPVVTTTTDTAVATVASTAASTVTSMHRMSMYVRRRQRERPLTRRADAKAGDDSDAAFEAQTLSNPGDDRMTFRLFPALRELHDTDGSGE